jgi:L-lactate dehydrogenase complex protein LldG
MHSFLISGVPMPSSREMILSRIRSALPQSSPLPDLAAVTNWQTFADPTEQFATILKLVGGEAVRVRNLAEADAHLRAQDHWTNGKIRVSVVPGVGDSTIDINAIVDPHDLENVDFSVLQGHFAVAENAAIWVTDDTLKHRVLYFIPQHIAIVVPAPEVVNNLHEAYDRIAVGKHAFAGFISGPSKTADIEQSLVIGAHGARSLIVYLVDDFQVCEDFSRR